MECIQPLYLRDRDIDVPCGKCGACLSTKRSDWAFRLECEARDHLDMSFVTLTYANNELTFISGTSQLVLEDLQKFFKRVRKRGYKFRYFAVGEYGSHTYRPHYHAIIFGQVPEQVLNAAWSKGLIHVGQVTPASVNYVCKYVVNSKAAFMKSGRIPPFSTQSRKPGLGVNYLRPLVVEWHKSALRSYINDHGILRHLPRYYRDKIFTKRERSIINNRDVKASIESLRSKLSELAKHHSNPLEYYEQMRLIASQRVKVKGKLNLTI